MKVRILTGIVFSIVIAGFIVPGFWTPVVPALLFASVLVLGSAEIHKALAAKHPETGSPTGLMVGALAGLAVIPIAIWLAAPSLAPVSSLVALAAAGFVLAVVAAASVLVAVLAHGVERVGSAGAAAAGMIYVAWPMYCAVAMLFAYDNAIFWVIPALLAPWITDVTAYFTGSLIGRHKIVPAISPKKTWEGCLGGLVGCMAAMPVWFLFAFPRQQDIPAGRIVLFALLLGLAASICAQVGDWFASAIKRWAGIKDFGNLFPGHGGVLDRFDSVLFTMPVFFAAAILFEAI